MSHADRTSDWGNAIASLHHGSAIDRIARELAPLAEAVTAPSPALVANLLELIAADRRLTEHGAVIRSAALLAATGQRRLDYLQLERAVQVAGGHIARWRTLVRTEGAIVQAANTPPLINIPDAVVYQRLVEDSGLLGSDGSHLVFLPPRSREIFRVGKSELTASALLALMPLAVCADYAPPRLGRGHFDSQVMADLLNRASEAMPPCRRTMLRGTGTWRVGSVVVANIGDWLVRVAPDGAIDFLPSGTRLENYVWLRQSPILTLQQNSRGTPILPARLRTRDGRRLRALARAWEFLPPGQAATGYSIAHVVVGWTAIAALGGALRYWRPHLWITGEHGSGKGELLTRFIGSCVAGLLQSVGATTEAGVRQSLGLTSLPHVLDEAEVQDPASRMRIEQHLELARGAADPSGAVVRKGGPDGHAMEFAAASMFCWASIAPPPLKNADASRIVIARLRAPPPEHDLVANRQRHERFARVVDAFATLQRRYADAGGLAAAVYVRMLELVHEFEHAEDLFRTALAAAGAGGRAVSAFAPTLAGAWMLSHDTPPTSAQAASEVTRHWLHGGMRDHLVDSKRGGAGRDIAEAVLAQPVRLQTRQLADIASSVGEALLLAAGQGVDTIGQDLHGLRARLQQAGVAHETARLTLGVGGIALTTPTRGPLSGQLCVDLAHGSRLVREALHGTDWAGGWQSVLKNMPGVLTVSGARIGGIGGLTAYRQPLLQFLGHQATDPAAAA